MKTMTPPMTMTNTATLDDAPRPGSIRLVHDAGPQPVEIVLRVAGLRLRRGGRPILGGVDLHVARGECVALMGDSGCGKTTILRTLLGLEPFEDGTVDVAGFALHPGPRRKERELRELRRRVGMVFQLHCLFEHLTALDNVMLAPIHHLGLGRAQAEVRARQLLHGLGIEARAEALPRELSGGEAQRVAIARALAMDPPLLLLDEPTASIDPGRRSALGDVIDGLCAAGRTLLVATHDDDFVRSYADRVVRLADGCVVEEGEPEQVLRRPIRPSSRSGQRSGGQRAAL